MAYQYTNKKGKMYYLHERQIKLKGSGKIQTIYFFSTNQGRGVLDEVPNGFSVKETDRSGLPVLKKK